MSGLPPGSAGTLTRLLAIEVELSPQLSAHNPTLFPRCLAGSRRRDPGRKCLPVCQGYFTDSHPPLRQATQGPEKPWHYHRLPRPLLDLSRPWGLSGKSWLATPTVGPWEAGCANQAMCFWHCREHLFLNKTCPQEPLPILQTSPSPCHHHCQAQHQHRVPFTYRFSIS